ncbi:Z band alternatively spliced PDZ-motif protein 52 isoform X2 [Haematobia irritans]|uniref:Z band alternatively spliced PDZ-motif protein 52 isoform X2 n=1 Tax=Haematobia irritans TaxID=7368 RepID=UPI003F506617
MAQPQMMQIKLSRFDAQPWGFRLQGGTDFAQPLLVQKVNGGSLAEKAGLMPGDAVIKINDVDVFNLRHKDAQDIVVRSGNNFVMTVQRGGSTWRPHVQLTGNVPHPNAGNLHTVTKTSLAHKQQEVQHIGSGYNNSARPFGGSAVDGNVKSIVNKQYNTPVGIYSDESIAETLSAQAEVLAGGVLGVNFKKNEKEYQADKSEVLKFLREEESGTSTPAFSNYPTQEPQQQQQYQPQQQQQYQPQQQQYQPPQQQYQPSATKHVSAPVTQPKPPSTGGLPTGQNICFNCERLITGVFVRIKDKNLHVECFKCATCGTNLKNQGYYNFNNKLYCDIHAKLAALQNPPPGTEGYVPVPIKPNTKLSASTISSALNTHGYNNGVSNGSSTPTPAPAADMNLNDLPLPPPPSPTQLQQYEQDQGNVTNISNIPPPPPHTRTLSSLSSMSSGSNTTHSSTHSLSPTPYQYQHQGQGPCNNVIMQTHNITMDPYASTSPMHSRQTSSSSSSLNYASDNNYMTSPPPPPPPPLPLPSMLPPAAEDNRNGDLYIDTMKQQQNAIGSNNSSKLLTNRNNENDKNSYNKSGNGNGIGVGNGTTFQPNTHKVAPTAVTGPTSTITTTKSPSSSNIPIVDKSLINSNNTYNPESNTTTTTTTFNTGTNDMSSTMASSGPSVQPTSETSSNGVGGDKPFEYVTLTGNVIRSVVPPGKGTNVNYKVNNQGYARPYGAPPAAAPKSPVTFPPQTQQWNAPPPTQPKPSAPAGNPYATLPRSNVGQGQDETNEEGLQPQYAETYFEEDYEVEEANRQMRSNFCWPPQQDDSHRTPTAAPLYIPPPETQHVEVKPIENPPPPEIGEKKHTQPQQQQHQEQQKQPQHPQYQKSSQQGGEHAECRTIQVTQQQAQSQTQSQWQVTQQQAQSQTQWQSRSAPQLTVGVQSTECESGSDSYTSTCTTATTTSEEYQRMYAAQVQAYQMQQLYDQSGSEFDYHMDMEVASMQQSHDQLQLCSSEYLSGRRSAQDCVETLVPSLCTYKLVDMVREVTPSPVPQQSSSQGSRRVVFQDDPEVKVLETPTQQGNEMDSAQATPSQTQTQQTPEESHEVPEQEDQVEVQEEGLVREDRSHILESQRLFQPTPEIKYEIAPVRQIPPTKIPNPTPKEWINPMVAVLTTAPETPFHMMGCLCPKPCDCSCQVDPAEEVSKVMAEEPSAEANPEPCERPLSPTPEPEPVPINSVWETPTLTKAMTIAPPFELKFAPPASEGVPLPEETVPYMPPPMDMKPYLREDYRPKSPFVSALTTAPDRPFEGHFDRDVPIHILDLPTPTGVLTMADALRTAPERQYTPLDPENATHRFEEEQKEKEKKKLEFQVLDKEEELGIRKQSIDKVEYFTTDKRKSSTSAFAAMQAFQPSNQPLSSTSTPATPRNSLSYTKAESDIEYQKFCDAQDRYQKRRSYFSQKEQELLQQQQQQTHTTTTTTSTSQEQQQQSKQLQAQTNTREESSLYSSTKASSSSSNTSSAVQQQQEQQYQKQQQTSSYASNLTQASTKSSSASYTTMAYDKVATSLSKHEAHEVIEETAQDLEHSEVIFPPPSPLSHLHTKTSTGLHRPENIPKYQRNWTVLPSQSPVRTPEPHELRENVPLAFVDTPKTPGHSMGSYENTVHKPVAQMSTRTSSATNNNTTSSSTTNNNSNLTAHQQHTSASAYGSTSVMSSQADQRHQQSVASASSHSSHSMARPQATKPTTVPIIIEDRAGPVTMAFQPLDEHMVRDHSQTPSRPYTPSRPAPIVPRYQTPEKLCFDECPAAHARDYDFRSASPFPDRARSPACGPPPNPLAAIRAPRIKDPDVSSMSPRVLQAGSITTGQSYLGAQQAQKQEQILAHTESSSHSGMQSFSQQPEKKEEYQIGNMSVQKREQSSRMAEQQQRQMQSQTTTQVGNTQIERRRKVTEEYEHTSSAKTVEIRTGSQSSSTDRRQSTASYGKGYVANQARRLSGLEQEITNLTPQSQAISARAAHLTENKFPEFHSPEPLEKFPTKPLLPSYDEPKPPSYIVSGASTKSVANTSSSCYQQKQEQKQLSTAYGSSVFSSQQQQQQQQKSLTTYSSVSSSQQQQQQQVNTVSSSVTKASAATNNQAYKSITAGTNNQTATSSSSASTGICPVTGTFCRPGHTCCKQQSMHSNNNTNNNNNNNNVSNGAAYRPNASLGSASNASNFAANSQPPRQQQQQQSQATAPATKAPAASSASAPTTMSNQNNNGGSAGSTGSAGGMAPKGGSYGATSAPKRGRGVMNKPAGPGVRIPLCNSCGTQVRGPFITALGKIWCPEHFHCTNGNCRRPLQDIGFVEEKGDLYCEYCFEKYLAPGCSKCGGKIKGDCLNAIGKHFHPECFSCGHCGKLFGNTPFFLEDGMPYCEADWNELFTTKCFACGFPVEAGDRWVEALNHNYHSQCFNCTYCKQNLEGQSFYNKGGRPFCKNHAR